MDYTVSITPSNWETFLKTEPLRLAFRQTMSYQLRKISVGDRLIVYLAEKMCWSGIFRVSKEPYKSNETIYVSQPAFNVVLEVEALILPKPQNYVSIKTPELWDKLDRFALVDHTKSGWIYKAKLSRSLCKMSSRDTERIFDFLRKKDV